MRSAKLAMSDPEGAETHGLIAASSPICAPVNPRDSE